MLKELSIPSDLVTNSLVFAGEQLFQLIHGTVHPTVEYFYFDLFSRSLSPRWDLTEAQTKLEKIILAEGFISWIPWNVTDEDEWMVKQGPHIIYSSGA